MFHSPTTTRSDQSDGEFYAYDFVTLPSKSSPQTVTSFFSLDETTPDTPTTTTIGFLSRDPIGYIDGPSLYMNYFIVHARLDPTGLKCTIRLEMGHYDEVLGFIRKDRKDINDCDLLGLVCCWSDGMKEYCDQKKIKVLEGFPITPKRLKCKTVITSIFHRTGLAKRAIDNGIGQLCYPKLPFGCKEVSVNFDCSPDMVTCIDDWIQGGESPTPPLNLCGTSFEVPCGQPKVDIFGSPNGPL